MPDPASATEHAAEWLIALIAPLCTGHPACPCPDIKAEIRSRLAQAHAAGVAEGIERAAKLAEDTAAMWRAESRRSADPRNITREAAAADVLAAHATNLRALGRDLLAALCEATGLYRMYQRREDADPIRTDKPHGRIAFKLFPGGQFYIDLSIMPTAQQAHAAGVALGREQAAKALQPWVDDPKGAGMRAGPPVPPSIRMWAGYMQDAIRALGRDQEGKTP